MAGLFVSNLSSFGWKFVCDEDRVVSTLKQEVFGRIGLLPDHAEQFYLSSGGRNLTDNHIVKEAQYVYVVPRLPGGKGGFGSMLRAIGAQIEKTTNREACRDLSGRRLRDINEEMRLKKWIAKQAEKEQDKAKRRIEKLQKKLAAPKHVFNDPEYDRERSLLSEKVNDALSQGLAVAKSENGNKRSATDGESSDKKKPKLWLDFTQGLSSEDDDESELDSKVPSSVSCSSSSSSSSISSSSSSSSSEDDDDDDDDATVVDSIVKEVKEISEESSIPSTSKTEVVEPKQAIENETKRQETQVFERLDLNEFDSIEELEVLGLDRLKSELMALGLKCGGTLRQRAERLFGIKGLDKNQINKNLMATKQQK